MTIRRSTFVCISLAGCLIVAGCTNMTLLRTQELRAVQSRVDSLRVELVTQQKAMYEEQKLHSEMVRLLRADQQMKFSDIERRISEISSNLSENHMRLSKIDEKTAAVHKKLEAKMVSDSIAADTRTAEAEKLFQIAMGDFNAGRYEVALSGFRDIAAQYQGMPIAAEAEYWIAECYYARRSYTDAEREYMAYIKKHSDGRRLCVALYKLGLTYDKQNKVKSKEMVWKKALEQCPDSPEIQVIRSRMK